MATRNGAIEVGGWETAALPVPPSSLLMCVNRKNSRPRRVRPISIYRATEQA
jgi:hypothetical protein